MSESKLSQRCMKWLRQTYPHGFHYCTCDRHTSGIPDIISVVNGCAFFIELKVKGKKPKPLQQHFIDVINDNGCLYEPRRQSIYAYWENNFDGFKENYIKLLTSMKKRGA